MNSSEKMLFLGIEFLGMICLTISFNLNNAFTAYMLLFNLLIAFGRSPGHYNPGVSITALFYDIDNVKKNGFTTFLLIMTQLCGALAGLFITY